MVRSQVVRWVGLACGVVFVAFLIACGGGSSTPPPQIAVSVHPKGSSVVAGSRQQQFSASVSNDPQNRGVTWSVDAIAGGMARSARFLPPGSTLHLRRLGRIR